MASIELRNVTKAYGKVVTLKNINLRIEDGELAVLIKHFQPLFRI